MESQMILLHRLLTYLQINSTKNYTRIIDNMEIINILIEMKLIEIYGKIYINKGIYTQKLFIDITSKGQIFVNSYNQNFYKKDL